jgi:hypothetical protein
MDVLLNTADIQAASQQLKTKGSEMEAAIQAAESSISPLRSFKSPRISRDLEAWDNIKTTFKQSLENLLQAADELAKAAADNEAANS